MHITTITLPTREYCRQEYTASFPIALCLVVSQVQLAEAFERFWGRFGDRHLCVSRAMKEELQKHWSIKATVFYDRPPAQFEPTPLVHKVCVCHDLFTG